MIMTKKGNNERIITRASITAGIGDALNARSFLMEYCRQKRIPHKNIEIYTEKYWWMFEGLGFSRNTMRVRLYGLTPYRNFGKYDLPKIVDMDKCDECIAKNAGIKYTFDVRTPFPDFGPSGFELPERYVTLNTGYGELSGRALDPNFVSTKQWPIAYWNRLVELLNVPVIQIGGGLSPKPVHKVLMNLINRTTMQQAGTILRGALFHIDMEGGLVIYNQHLGGKSVVLFGPTAIENQGRSFNLNLRAGTCTPCYEWGTHKYELCVPKNKLECGAHCMKDLTPEYVAEQIYKHKWLKKD